MRYMLVIQWPADSFGDIEDLINIEDMLIARLPQECDVDGHDMGATQANIFVRTSDVDATFAALEAVFRETAEWREMKIAYRDAAGSNYTALHPKTLQQFVVS